MKQIKIIKKSSEFEEVNKPKKRVCAYVRVSTDDEEQLLSFNSQMKYYEAKISENKEWEFINIYSDEAVSGTKAKEREGFQSMIADCQNGKIDIIITKSISRFARNTIDTLHYVRMLKNLGIAVIFEEEHINTMAMEGELLLTILSSVAQQEVTNTSLHVKKGLRMKVQRGGMIGGTTIYGYDYNPETKQLTINPEEAKTIRYIFKRYAEGIGSSTISNELKKKHINSPRGNSSWHITAIDKIIRNEKYIGDCRFGKTITIDPIEKKRIKNTGQAEQYYMEGHHEAIISKELFDQANAQLQKRREKRFYDTKENPEVTHMRDLIGDRIVCACCGGTFKRRPQYSKYSEKKYIWKCENKINKRACTSKDIHEQMIIDGFIQGVLPLIQTSKNEFISILTNLLIKSETKVDASLEEQFNQKENKLKRIQELETDGIEIDKYIQERKREIEDEIKELQYQILATSSKSITKDLQERINSIKKTVLSYPEIKDFNEFLFDSLVTKIVIGGHETNGDFEPYRISFDLSTTINNAQLRKSSVIHSFDLPVTYNSFYIDKHGNQRRKTKKSILVIVSTLLCHIVLPNRGI